MGGAAACFGIFKEEKNEVDNLITVWTKEWQNCLASRGHFSVSLEFRRSVCAKELLVRHTLPNSS